VAIANTKLYMNAAEGFIGTSLKKDEFLCECSDYDDIIAFTKGGTMKVVKVSDKVFIGKDIIHAAVFEKNDERTTYNMIYLDGKSGM
jgi:topoisomerase-4 subunit A